MDSGNVLIDAFGEAVAVTLREMAGIEAAVRGSHRKPVARPIGVAALLRLSSGGVEGDFVLDFPAAVADEVARRIFAGSGTEPDEAMSRDCAGEVANVAAGQAKTLLFGTPQHFVFSTPIIGPEALPNPEAERSVIEFASEVGVFRVYLRAPG